MKDKIAFIRQRLKPSFELKCRVMELAAKLRAGKKTFGNESTTTDSSLTAAYDKKEQITMSINSSQTNTVRSHVPASLISVAACAAIVIGIAAVGLGGGNSELLTKESSDTTPAAPSAVDELPVTEKDDSAAENVMTVTDKDGGSYSITDQDRIAAIDALVEKTKKSHVWEDEPVQTERTIEYTVDGIQHTVEISEVQIGHYHPDNESHPELFRVVTVDDNSYVLCEYVPDEPFSELYTATGKGGDLTIDKRNEKNNDNNEDEFENDSTYEEYHNEKDARKLRDIIDDVRSNSTPQFEAENLYYYDEEHLPSWDTVRTLCSFDLDGNSYEVDLYRDSDLICIEVFDWHDGKTRTELYKDTQNWINEFNEVFGSLSDESDTFSSQSEEPGSIDPQEEEFSDDTTEQ